jgi:hypothetical protein
VIERLPAGDYAFLFRSPPAPIFRGARGGAQRPTPRSTSARLCARTSQAA